jgi:hypothetical protein
VALGALAACPAFRKPLGDVTRAMMLLVYRSMPNDKRRATLEKLKAELEKAIAAGDIALGEVNAALREIRPDAMFESEEAA